MPGVEASKKPLTAVMGWRCGESSYAEMCWPTGLVFSTATAEVLSDY